MLGYYLHGAVRHFRQHRVTTAINVLCLSLGIACFLLAWTVVESFAQRDRHHEKAERTYVVTQHFIGKDGNSVSPVTSVTPWRLTESLQTDFPELEHVARVTSLVGDELAVAAGENRGFAQVRFADPEFLRIFDLPMIEGDARTALESPRSAVISETLATRMFGTTRVVGRTLLLNNSQTVTITGVVGASRHPSHISVDDAQARVYFEALTSMDTRLALLTERDVGATQQSLESWNSNQYLTYVVLPHDGSLTDRDVSARLPQFVRQHVPAVLGHRQIAIEPISKLTEIDFGAMIRSETTGVSSTAALLILGALVLAVSCLNYANLASAQAISRFKEVALRRVVGARDGQVLLQHLVEGWLLSLAATLFALLALGLMLNVAADPAYTRTLSLMFRQPSFWTLLACIVAVIGCLGSLYPALAMLRVRASHSASTSRGKQVPALIFSLLVGVQFATSAFLLAALLVMGEQNREMRHAALGAAGDRVVIVGNDLKASRVDPALLNTELLAQPGIAAVSRVEGVPWSMWLSFEVVSASSDAHASQLRVHRHIVDYDFFRTLGISLLAGREFDRSRADDVGSSSALRSVSSGRYTVVIDRSLARRLGWNEPQQAVGHTIYNDADGAGPIAPNELRVIGVVEDAAFKPLGFGARASFFVLDPVAASTTVVRLSGNDIAAALGALDRVWKSLAPDVPLKRRFSDEQFDQAFRFLSVISSAFAVVAGFALLIAIMGLIGMSLHVTSRRKHEIGVRKTLGASVAQILIMLLKHFSKPIVIANLAVWPFVLIAMQLYLSMFTHSTALTPMPFAVSLIATLCIAWIAVGGQAWRAARVKPAEVLRYE